MPRCVTQLVLVSLASLASPDTADKENRNYLGVFTIVKFSNDACQGGGDNHQTLTTIILLLPGSASNRVGQCLEYASCYMAGGYGDGSCAEVLMSIIKYFYLDN